MNAKNLCIAGAVAAMFAASGNAVFAQTDTTTTTSNMTVVDTTTTTAVITDKNGNPIPLDAYRLLAKPLSYNAMDIRQAREEGLSHGQIATIAKIADLSGQSFNQVASDVLAGQSFGILADRYNLRLKDVLDASDYRDQIRMYMMAYNATGKGAARTSVMASQQVWEPTTTTTTTTNTLVTPPVTTTPMAPAPNTVTPTVPNGQITPTTPNDNTAPTPTPANP
jgi:hypothetical protein